MAELKDQLKTALEELRKGDKRKFIQTVDLIVNLQKFDIRKNSVNIFVSIPHKIKDKRVCGFLEIENKKIKTITKNEFKKYSDKKEMKKLIKSYDFFIGQASLMPAVATTFGRVLGPVGKMPSPQLGILMNVDDKALDEVITKINNSIKIRTQEPSIKVAIGKESMSDEEIIANIMAVYKAVLKNVPREKENIKNIEIKFTMTKPQKVKVRD